MYYSQLVSGIALLILIFGFHFKSISLTTIFVLFFIQSLFKQLFEGARETHSKFQGENANQLSLQSQILSGLYNAQFVGPILSYLLIKSLPIEIPLTLDCLSFFLAAFIASKLTHSPPIQKGEATHVFAPFFYLNKFPKLRDITLLRSIGFWLGNGLFNYLMFAVVTEHFKLDIINSTWIYSFLGLGGVFATLLIHNSKTKEKRFLGRFEEWKLAFIGQFSMGLTFLGFVSIPSFYWALFLVFIFGICMGINAISTQALRRIFSTQKQFPEIVGIEVLVGRSVDVLISSGAQANLISNPSNYRYWAFAAALIFMINASLHFRFKGKLFRLGKDLGEL